MLLAALVLNLIILLPLLWVLRADSPAMIACYGPDTAARRILSCVYGAIAVASAGLIALHVVGHPWALPMTLSLFSVQILYKTATAYIVPLRNPVVQTNLAVVGVQGVALATTFGSLPGG